LSEYVTSSPVLRVEEQLPLHVHAHEVVELQAEAVLRDLDHQPS
jgi:hypothetical protein